jgi:hypothetical protein
MVESFGILGSDPLLALTCVIHIEIVSMKSAYELAMERLKADDKEIRQELTDAQRADLADIEKVFRARMAERDVFLKRQLIEVRAAGNRSEEEAVLKQIASERALLEQEMEEQKQVARKRFSS